MSSSLPSTDAVNARELAFTQLSDKAKDHVRNGLMQPNAYDFDCVVEQWTEDGIERGFVVDEGTGSRTKRAFWQLSYSQGDGAAWEGDVDLQLWIKYHMPEWESTPWLLALLEMLKEGLLDRYVKVRCGSRGNTCMLGDYEDHLPEWKDETQAKYYRKVRGGVFEGATYESLAALIADDWYDSMMKAIETSVRAWAAELYSRLQTEDEHLTSDEYIAETAEANDWRFDEDGELIQS